MPSGLLLENLSTADFAVQQVAIMTLPPGAFARQTRVQEAVYNLDGPGGLASTSYNIYRPKKIIRGYHGTSLITQMY